MSIKYYWILLYVWIAVGIYDLILEKKGKLTISQRIEALFPRGTDVGIIVVVLILTWVLGDRLGYDGLKGFIIALSFTMLGHMFLGHEQYEK